MSIPVNPVDMARFRELAQLLYECGKKTRMDIYVVDDYIKIEFVGFVNQENVKPIFNHARVPEKEKA